MAGGVLDYIKIVAIFIRSFTAMEFAFNRLPDTRGTDDSCIRLE